MSGYAVPDPTPPRRRAIQLGVGAVVTGVLGAALYRTAHRIEGTTVRGTVEAPSLGGTQAAYTLVYPRGIDAHQPVVPGGGQGSRLPVVVVLHDRGGDSSVVTRLGLDEALGRAVVQDGAAPFALAAVSGGDRWWRAGPDGTDAGALVLDKFLPWLAALGLAAGAEHRVGLLGVGMGGYGALRLAQELAQRPDAPAVAGVAVAGPTLWRTADAARQQDPGVFADAADFARGDLRSEPDALAGVPLRVECGGEDPYLPAVREVLGVLRPPPTVTVTAGGHDLDTWKPLADGQIRFLGTALAAGGSR